MICNLPVSECFWVRAILKELSKSLHINSESLFSIHISIFSKHSITNVNNLSFTTESTFDFIIFVANEYMHKTFLFDITEGKVFTTTFRISKDLICACLKSLSPRVFSINCGTP